MSQKTAQQFVIRTPLTIFVVMALLFAPFKSHASQVSCSAFFSDSQPQFVSVLSGHNDIPISSEFLIETIQWYSRYRSADTTYEDFRDMFKMKDGLELFDFLTRIKPDLLTDQKLGLGTSAKRLRLEVQGQIKALPGDTQRNYIVNELRERFRTQIEQLMTSSAKSLAKKLSSQERQILMTKILRLSLNFPSQITGFSYEGYESYMNLLNHPLNEMMSALSDERLNIRVPLPGSIINGQNDPTSLNLVHKPETYLTSYGDYARFYNSLNLKPGQRIVEVGSALGRGAIVLKLLFPEVEYVGYEILKARWQEANRMSAQNNIDARFLNEDVTQPGFRLAEGDFYFMYNPVEFDPIPNLEFQLRGFAQTGRQVVVISVPLRENQSAAEKLWLKKIELDEPILTNRSATFYLVNP